MLKPSGAAWCAQYPGSKLIADLLPDFAQKVGAFLSALTAGGATYLVNATYRPPERAYLMHFACMIGSGQDPAQVPPMPGVDIDWSCGGDIVLARHNARAMMAGYGIAFPAALQSRHTQRRAVDMNITISDHPKVPYKFKDAAGKYWSFGPLDTASLYKFGATFGVIKLVTDPPHWSDDGH